MIDIRNLENYQEEDLTFLSSVSFSELYQVK